MGKKAQLAEIQFVDGRLSVDYPDLRVAPRICKHSNMRREFCPCFYCRALRRRKHHAICHCFLCFSDRMGKFVDDLGRRTQAGKWLWFITLTFRTPHFPWARRFPIEQPKPASDFVHHYFAAMIRWIEFEVHHPVEYFTADQFGEIAGRIHLHCGLSWPGLFEYRWKNLQAMIWNGVGAENNRLLRKGAGFNRILPWQLDAGYYIGRYVGRDAQRAHWDWNVGVRTPKVRVLKPIGRKVLVASSVPDESSREFRRTMGSWHR